MISLYFHTLRHLKLRQMAYQVIRRLSKPSLPQLLGPAIQRFGVYLKPVIPRSMPLADEHTFRFLNEERLFSPEAIDWQPAAAGKLWRYNLHYFEYILEQNRSWESCCRLINDWIAHNPPGSLDAWEPFPVSLRVVNWIKLFLRSDNGCRLQREWLESLFRQMLWLEKNIEYHLLGNHVFKNGKALVFGGLFFAGDDAERWLRLGLKILLAELDEQILPDGGHFERSPMYHAMILTDCLDLLNLTMEQPEQEVAEFAGRLRVVCPAMLSALAVMSHPDGGIALFNDAAFGIEANLGELAEYYQRLTGLVVPCSSSLIRSLPDTGYFVMAPTPGSYLIIDCGAVGPDYQPGHSHCDSLSFELSLEGRRVIVDSGCGQYPVSDIRTYNRGNVGHNTLTIDAQNQSEVWGAHRCARRAKPLFAVLERLPDGGLKFSGAHDGYCRLTGQPVHRRSVTWRDKVITITDDVEGRGTHNIELRLHINPELTVEQIDEKICIRDGACLIATITSADASRIIIAAGHYCQEFGNIRPAQVLVLYSETVSLPFRNGWHMQLP